MEFDINDELSKYFGNSCIDIIITSHGTLDIKRLSQHEKKLAQLCKEQVNMVQGNAYSPLVYLLKPG